MAYSTIRPKYGKCSECPPDGPDKRLTRGLCPFHYNINLLDRARRKRVDLRSLIQTQLNRWFREAAEELAERPYCEECGEFIPEMYRRHATAHVLPKRLFKSVATHPKNKLFLGATCGCHPRYDSAWSNAQEMKIWPKAVMHFKAMYLDIVPGERRFIPVCLLKTIES